MTKLQEAQESLSNVPGIVRERCFDANIAADELLQVLEATHDVLEPETPVIEPTEAAPTSETPTVPVRDQEQIKFTPVPFTAATEGDVLAQLRAAVDNTYNPN